MKTALFCLSELDKEVIGLDCSLMLAVEISSVKGRVLTVTSCFTNF